MSNTSNQQPLLKHILQRDIIYISKKLISQFGSIAKTDFRRGLQSRQVELSCCLVQSVNTEWLWYRNKLTVDCFVNIHPDDTRGIGKLSLTVTRTYACLEIRSETVLNHSSIIQTRMVVSVREKDTVLEVSEFYILQISEMFFLQKSSAQWQQYPLKK